MKEDQIGGSARKATEASLEFTCSMIGQSKKLRAPSPKAAKIGSAVGGCVGGCFLLTGMVQLLMGSPLWALGTLSAGLLTVLSNLISYHKMKKQI